MLAEPKTNYALLEREKPINILAVEDDIIAMKFLEKQITALGHTMFTADNGQASLAVLEANHGQIDVILMDREMPVMNGLDAVKRIKDNKEFRNIPVIMVTGADTMNEIREGLDAGVFYYLTKPVQEDMLRSVLSAAVRKANQSKTLAEELGKHRTSFNLIQTCKFSFQTIAEAESLAAFIANCFPDPQRTITGLGELLINAIEHGNLGIGYEKKTELINSGTWRPEIERLQTLPENSGKFCTAAVTRKEDGIYVVIEDQGNGFEWGKFMSIEPARAGDSHGRGIAQANTTSFDKITYNVQGNKVVAYTAHQKQLEW